MAIAINGSGTITGISAGGLPDGVITTDDIAANAVTYAKIGTTEQGQLCKAWVNFNGTGTVAIRASYNVSSITDNGTGDYTVNFTTALADGNYNFVIAGRETATAAGRSDLSIQARSSSGSYVSGSIRVMSCYASDANVFDAETVCVAIFR